MTCRRLAWACAVTAFPKSIPCLIKLHDRQRKRVVVGEVGDICLMDPGLWSGVLAAKAQRIDIAGLLTNTASRSPQAIGGTEPDRVVEMRCPGPHFCQRRLDQLYAPDCILCTKVSICCLPSFVCM